MDPAGLAAEAQHVVNAASCLHSLKDTILVSLTEFNNGLFPYCDFNVNAQGVKHAAVTAANQTFFTCRDCHMIICKNCNTANSLFLLILPNF
jgi:hypothetical protein